MIELKRLKEYPKYYITSTGLVISKRGVLSGSIANNGYLRVSLRKDNKTKYVNVHRLVAETFLKRSDSLYMINHKDKNKLNNNVANLEWCDHSQNNAHSRRGNKRGVRYEKRRGHFVATLWCRDMRKPIYLGSYETEAKAQKAYNKAYKEKYGVQA